MMAWENFNIDKYSLLVGIPIHPSVPMLAPEFLFSMIESIKPSISSIETNREWEVDVSRNQIVEKFLTTGYSHLLFLDSDIILQKDTILRLFSHNQPVVSGLYFEKGGTMQSAAWFHSRVPWKRAAPIEIKEDSVLVPAELIGLGVCLIQRDVFLKMKKPWFQFTLNRTDLPDDERISEDFYWSWMLYKQLGIHPLVDVHARVGHLGRAIVQGPGQATFL